MPSALAAAVGRRTGLPMTTRSPSMLNATEESNARRSSASRSDDGGQLGVGRVEHLEAAVERVAVDVVGADPAADGVAALEQPDLQAAGGQRPGAGEPGQTAADHDHVGVRLVAHRGLPWGWRNSGGR